MDQNGMDVESQNQFTPVGDPLVVRNKHFGFHPAGRTLLPQLALSHDISTRFTNDHLLHGELLF